MLAAQGDNNAHSPPMDARGSIGLGPAFRSMGTGTGLLTQPRMPECKALCTARGLDVTMADAATACSDRVQIGARGDPEMGKPGGAHGRQIILTQRDFHVQSTR